MQFTNTLVAQMEGAGRSRSRSLYTFNKPDGRVAFITFLVGDRGTHLGVRNAFNTFQLVWIVICDITFKQGPNRQLIILSTRKVHLRARKTSQGSENL